MSRVPRFADATLLVAVFTITFARVRWDVAGLNLGLSDIAVAGFVATAALERIGRRDVRVPRAAGVLALFLAGFLVVYLLGFFDLETTADRDQFVKGLAKFVLHFVFLVAAVGHLAIRSERFFWHTLGSFLGGIAANAAYALVEVLYTEGTGRFLDPLVLGPLTGDESPGIPLFGRVAGLDVYRTNGLMLDTNHLGVVLVVPLLVLLPLYLRLERGHRMRTPLVLTLSLLALVEIATLSRSGMLGVAVGLAVLALPYRHLLATRSFVVPLGAVLAAVALVALQFPTVARALVHARFNVGGGSTQAHLDLYELLPPAFGSHPLFGRGLNTFSVYFEFLTGRTNWGPHSFWVALLIETGIVGTALFLALLVYTFRRLRLLHRVGRLLAAAGDVRAARVRPLAWGLTAALAGTMAANAFYLTMQMYYFFVLLMLGVAAPLVFVRGVRNDTAP